MTIKFYLKNPKEHRNTILVRVRDGRRLDITSTTDEIVNMNDWDAKIGSCLTIIEEYKNGKMVKGRSAEIAERINRNTKVNFALAKLSEIIEKAYKNSDKTKLDKEWLKQIIFPERYYVEEEKEPNILEYCKIYLEEKEDGLKKGTVKDALVKKVRTIINLLTRYFEYQNSNPLQLIQINKDFKRNFEDYCLEVEEYKPAYVQKLFKFIKTIVFHSASNGFQIYGGLHYTKCRIEKTLFEILSFDELAQIEKTELEKSHHLITRDWLIIGCYTGQRVSDLLKFSTSDIKEEIVDGKTTYFIGFTQQKTNKQLSLALHSKVVEILKKYEWSFPPKICEQRFNLYIKDIAKLAGIDKLCESYLSTTINGKTRKRFGNYPKYKLLSSHCCRRSFCSNFYGLIPTETLMSASGHSSQKSFLNYIGDVSRQQSLDFARQLNSITKINL